MSKTACIHTMCSVCSVGLPRHLLKIQLHCRTECWKRNWRFILPFGYRLMGHHILNLAIFVVTAPRRKTFWFEQKWDCHSGYVILSEVGVYFITSKRENTALSSWSRNTINFSFVHILELVSDRGGQQIVVSGRKSEWTWGFWLDWSDSG
jgi:hypothetical protein